MNDNIPLPVLSSSGKISTVHEKRFVETIRSVPYVLFIYFAPIDAYCIFRDIRKNAIF